MVMYHGTAKQLARIKNTYHTKKWIAKVLVSETFSEGLEKERMVNRL